MDKKRLLQDLIDGLATAGEGLKKKEAEDFIRLYFDTIQQSLLNDRVVKVNGLGTFKLIEVEARNSVDVNTGQSVVIPEHLKLSFLPESDFKEAINKPFSDFEPLETSEIKSVTAGQPEAQEQPETEGQQETNGQTESPELKETTVPQEAQEQQESRDSYQKTEPSAKPIQQPGIKEMLDELTATEPPMKPENPRRPVRTLLLVLAGILFLAGLTYWSVVSNQSAKRDMTEKLQLVEEYNKEDTVGLSPNYDYEAESEAELSDMQASAPDTMVAVPAVKKTTPSTQATVQTPIKKQTTTASETAKPTIKQPSAVQETAKPAKKQTIPASVVIGSGDRLTLIAQKYYGHKVFWVYIYMENKASISNPNSVPVGTTLRLPEKHPTAMDPNNPQSIQKAEELQERIIKQLQASRTE